MGSPLSICGIGSLRPSRSQRSSVGALVVVRFLGLLLRGSLRLWLLGVRPPAWIRTWPAGSCPSITPTSNAKCSSGSSPSPATRLACHPGPSSLAATPAAGASATPQTTRSTCTSGSSLTSLPTTLPSCMLGSSGPSATPPNAISKCSQGSSCLSGSSATSSTTSSSCSSASPTPQSATRPTCPLGFSGSPIARAPCALRHQGLHARWVLWVCRLHQRVSP
mmetsp:Transcript_126926/g.317181  ORF Transcript_126926/g.317181 Transcript_126926/m.317181 type:complete len:221 (-) Transcript_126926:372-1034(-)